MIDRKISTYRQGDVVDVAEHPEGRHGAPGMPRRKKKKLTPMQMKIVNRQNKARRCRAYLLEYFHPGDMLVTYTYRVEERPPDMKEALKDFQKVKRYIQREYRKRGYELFWIRNIERGTRGAWHFHIVVNSIPDTPNILKGAWKRGNVDMVEIKDSNHYDEDFTKLANYMTKDETTREKKKDGTLAKPKLKEASYNHSRNMHLKKPKPDKLVRWKKEVKPKKGYYIARIHEGINPFTGYKYRRYTMIRLNRRI